MQNIDTQFENFKNNISDMIPDLGEYCYKAWQEYNSVDFPTKKSEDWKYTNISRQIKKSFIYSTPDSTQLDIKSKFKGDADIVFVDGHLDVSLSTSIKSEGVNIYSIKDLFSNGWEGCSLTKEEYFQHLDQFDADENWLEKKNKFDLLNNSFLLNGYLLVIEKNVALEAPLHILNVYTCDADSFVPQRNLMLAQTSAQATVVESYISLNENSAHINTTTDVVACENSNVELARLQDLNTSTFHYYNVRAHLNKNSVVRFNSVDLGGEISRINSYFNLNGENAESHYNGLYLSGDNQSVDTSSYIRHSHELTFSHQLVKGILVDKGEATFNGRLFIAKDAQKVDASQLNKNLVLSDKATINTKPQLEVFADDVKAAHGATIGQLDPDELFYLMSRCVSKPEAIKMLAKGFVEEILYKTQNSSLKKFLLSYCDHKISSFLSGKDISIAKGRVND